MLVCCRVAGVTYRVREDTLMAGKTAQEKGYDFEDFTQTVLFKLRENSRAAFHRFYDTKSTAGGILPGQPGDFLLVKSGVALIIECKSSVVESTMSRKYISSSVDTEQAAKMWVFTRAGAKGIYLFYSEITDKIEVWPCNYIRTVAVTPRMQPDLGQRIDVFSKDKDQLYSFLENFMRN